MAGYSNLVKLSGFKGSCSRLRVSEMDFQLARNLSARAQEEISQAILQIDSTADCLSREIIMAAANSEATEQLLASQNKLSPGEDYLGDTS